MIADSEEHSDVHLHGRSVFAGGVVYSRRTRRTIHPDPEGNRYGVLVDESDVEVRGTVRELARKGFGSGMRPYPKQFFHRGLRQTSSDTSSSIPSYPRVLHALTVT